MRRALAPLIAAAALAGCGSQPVAELPPPAGPAASPPLTATPAGRVVRRARGFRFPRRPARATSAGGRLVAAVAGRARRLELYDARRRRRVASAPAGVGPTTVVAADGRFYVADTRQGALLIFDRRPRFELQRRVYLPGGPYALAVDPARRRLWVTLTARNELVRLTADGVAKFRGRYPTVRQPDAVAVDARTGTVAVRGRGAVQVLRIGGHGR